MKIIGMTGPSGSGKGEVGAVLASLGVPVLDTDAVYHELTAQASPCVKELEEAFGADILLPDGALDRHRLSAIVFCGGSEQTKRCETLNRITHAHVLREVRVWLAACRARGERFAVVDAPMLFESGLSKECDLVLSVLADRETRIARICARDGISQKQAEARLSAQKNDEFFRQNSDAVIENDGDLPKLRERVQAFLRSL